jgi:hypothetical protein
MTTTEPSPPRWAEAVLRSVLRPADRESISGDLLEEYREVRRPTLGALRANAWYIKHVSNVLWQLIRPYALVLAAQGVLLAVTVFRPGHHAANFRPEMQHAFLTMMIVKGLWYGSLVGTPGVSLFDAAIYFFVAFRSVQRTRLIKTGMLAAGATSFVGMTVLFAAAAIITPGLVLAIGVNPLLLIIVSVYLLVPLGYGVLLGALAGVVGRWVAPAAPWDTRVA